MNRDEQRFEAALRLFVVQLQINMEHHGNVDSKLLSVLAETSVSAADLLLARLNKENAR